MSGLIDTPYGRKTPELLCKAMDALQAQPELLDALKLAQCVIRRLDIGGNARTLEVIAAVIAKARGED